MNLFLLPDLDMRVWRPNDRERIPIQKIRSLGKHVLAERKREKVDTNGWHDEQVFLSHGFLLREKMLQNTDQGKQKCCFSIYKKGLFKHVRHCKGRFCCNTALQRYFEDDRKQQETKNKIIII